MNVLSELEDDQCFKDIEALEAKQPSIPISMADGAAPVYKSRDLPLEIGGIPILTDFGQMRPVETCTSDVWCMPDLYRAPEVLLRLPFRFPVDI